MKLIIFLLFYTINLVYSNNNFTINKCCPPELILNSKFNGCIKSNFSEFIDLQLNFTSLINNSIDFNYYNTSNLLNGSLNLPCKSSNIKVLFDVEEYDISSNGILTPKDIKGVQDFNSSEYCLDNFINDEGDLKNVVLTCPCLRGTCVRVCCGKGKMLETTSASGINVHCVDAPEEWIDWTVDNYTFISEQRNFYTVYGGQPLCNSDDENLKILYQSLHENNTISDSKSNLTIFSNGTLQIYKDLMQKNETIEYKIPASKFCIGLISKNDNIELSEIICHNKSVIIIDSNPTEEKLNKNAIYSLLYILGALFLLATIIVHIMLPELRIAVRGLSLMAHCACMLVAHISLSILEIKSDTLSDTPCYFFAYISLFSLLTGFFWMNVMCIDISLTFRSLQGMAADSNFFKRDEMRKFLYYVIYAMGIPSILLLITIWANKNEFVPESIRPNIGKSQCWFETSDAYAILAYFYGPVGLLLLINSGLFILTAGKIFKFSKQSVILNQQTSQRHDRNSKERKSFMLFLKLFGLMGISWVMEIVSWVVGGEDYYWYLTDAINLLRSVFIFIMFCWKKKVWEALKTKYPKIKSPPKLLRGLMGMNSPQHQHQMHNL